MTYVRRIPNAAEPTSTASLVPFWLAEPEPLLDLSAFKLSTCAHGLGCRLHCASREP